MRTHSAALSNAICRIRLTPLREEFGPTGDPDSARAHGVDPEVLLGPPPTSTTDSDWVGFAAWASADSWIFVAGRHYRVADSSRTLLLVGVAREGDAIPARLV